MRQFTYIGNQYLLGQSEQGYGIWAIGQEYADPAAYFPPSPQGWDEALRAFQRIEPNGRPIATPSQQVATSPVSAYHYAAPGYVVPQQVGGLYGQPGAPWGQPNGMATAGGVVGISGAALSLIPFFGIVIGLVTGVLAIIFSGIGLSRTASTGSGKGLAVTGLVLGILTVIFKLIPGVNLF